ncbi:MAG: Uma2 family endonuclease [Leptospiraceae bacterium]|nr:Uma2 family endonuclease [Leptospiraceae bacterium]MCP5494652.1 Uma2 family endonuclease [Leptospiraceae bacterium]
MEEKALYYTETEYLDLEENSETKNEYFNGQIYAMAGASVKHITIASNLIMSLGFQLRKKNCVVFGSDMRVKISDTGLYTYPDISIACEDRKLTGDKTNTLLNPVVIVEVLSDSTERYDRGEKFAHYRQLSSLQEYVLVSQNSKKIEKFSRNSAGKWELTETTVEVPEIDLPMINCKLSIEEVYDKVDMDK